MITEFGVCEAESLNWKYHWGTTWLPFIILKYLIALN